MYGETTYINNKRQIKTLGKYLQHIWYVLYE